MTNELRKVCAEYGFRLQIIPPEDEYEIESYEISNGVCQFSGTTALEVLAFLGGWNSYRELEVPQCELEKFWSERHMG